MEESPKPGRLTNDVVSLIEGDDNGIRVRTGVMESRFKDMRAAGDIIAMLQEEVLRLRERNKTLGWVMHVVEGHQKELGLVTASGDEQVVTALVLATYREMLAKLGNEKTVRMMTQLRKGGE